MFVKSIFRKFSLILFAFLLLMALGFGGFQFVDLDIIYFYYFIGALASIFVFTSVLYYWILFRPLKSVLFQIQAMLAGKPYKKIYTTRVDEVGVLSHFFNRVSDSFGEVSFELQDRDRIKDELSVAAQLQRDILPLTSPVIAGLEVSAKNKPATEVGGDSFNIFKKKDKTFLYLGDVTGHGVAAGLIMTMVNSLMGVFVDYYDTALDITVHVNRYIKQHIKKAMFMTMVMLSWDEKTKKMTFVGAGHEYILVYRPQTGQCESILSGGVALGMIPDNSKVIKEQSIALAEGDFVILYSDGITEARNDQGELYGLERLKTVIKEYCSQYSAEGVNYHIAREVTAFMGKHAQDDDMTLIVIKRTDSLSADDKVEKNTNW